MSATTGPHRAVVFHPETQHSKETALALQKAGMLALYLTGIYARRGGALGLGGALLPRRPRERVSALAARRHLAGLDGSRIRTRPLFCALDAMARNVPALHAAFPEFHRFWVAAMERWAGRMVARSGATAVVAYDSAALETFAAARKVGALCILDQTVGHVGHGRALLREEAARHPDWAAPGEGGDPDWMVEKCRAEALAADWLLAPSDYVRDTLLAVGVPPARIVAMPYGVDLARFTPGTEAGPERPFRILFVGTIGLRKGVLYLLEAVKRLRLARIEVVLIGDIVGNPAGLSPYAGLFTHRARISRAEMPEQYRAADLFVFPSLHEGSALAIYEALASGLPVVCTRNAGSIVRNGIDGYIVPIRDAESLAARIEALYRDRALLAAMGQSARERAGEFGWESYRRRLADWFRGLPADGERARSIAARR